MLCLSSRFVAGMLSLFLMLTGWSHKNWTGSLRELRSLLHLEHKLERDSQA